MAFKGEVYITGPGNTAVPGPRPNGSSLIYEFDHEVYLPFDMEENKVQGSRRMGAFSIIKEVDKMTPILYQYCCTGETLDQVIIVLYKIKEGQGTETPYFNYTLKDAQIVSIKDYMPSTKYSENENVGHLEKVKISANVFVWNNEPTDPKGEGDPYYEDSGFTGEEGGS